MDVPQYVINRIIAINKSANTIKNNQRIVVSWLEARGLDTFHLDREYNILEMAEYGELNNVSHEDIEKLIIDTLQSAKKERSENI